LALDYADEKKEGRYVTTKGVNIVSVRIRRNEVWCI